jgi:hypothetical protein
VEEEKLDRYDDLSPIKPWDNLMIVTSAILFFTVSKNFTFFAN